MKLFPACRARIEPEMIPAAERAEYALPATQPPIRCKACQRPIRRVARHLGRKRGPWRHA
jgi:hypothetical protein